MNRAPIGGFAPYHIAKARLQQKRITAAFQESKSKTNIRTGAAAKFSIGKIYFDVHFEIKPDTDIITITYRNDDLKEIIQEAFKLSEVTNEPFPFNRGIFSQIKFKRRGLTKKLIDSFKIHGDPNV